MIDMIVLLLSFAAGYALAIMTWPRVRTALADFADAHGWVGTLVDGVSAMARAAFDRVRR